ncbi:MAG: ABC transporter permease [Brevinematia bacterium]
MVGRIGRWLINKADYFSGVISLTVYSFLELAKYHPPNQKLLLYQNTIKQIFFTSVQALKSVITVSMLISIATVSITFIQFPEIVPKDTIADIFVKVIFREIMPLMLMIIVIARSVSAITVEIGNMTVNREFDILVSIGIDPLFYLLLPRLLGMIISLLILFVFASFTILVLGPMALLLFYEINFAEITNLIFSKVSVGDFALLFTKFIIVGAIIPSVASYHGFKTPTINFVPVSATKSIMASLSFSIVTSLALSILFYIFVF